MNPAVHAQQRWGVQVGAADATIAVRLASTGRFLAHILDADPAVVEQTRQRLQSEGRYGLVTGGHWEPSGRLPFSENLVNLQFEVFDAQDNGQTIAALAWAGQRLYLAGSRGALRVMSVADGQLLNQGELPAPLAWDSLAIAGGRLVVSLIDGSLVCLGER